MKQYRIKTKTGWHGWKMLTDPIKDLDILTIQFNEPLTIEEAKEFFKYYVDKV